MPRAALSKPPLDDSFWCLSAAPTTEALKHETKALRLHTPRLRRRSLTIMGCRDAGETGATRTGSGHFFCRYWNNGLAFCAPSPLWAGVEGGDRGGDEGGGVVEGRGGGGWRCLSDIHHSQMTNIQNGRKRGEKGTVGSAGCYLSAEGSSWGLFTCTPTLLMCTCSCSNRSNRLSCSSRRSCSSCSSRLTRHRLHLGRRLQSCSPPPPLPTPCPALLILPPHPASQPPTLRTSI